MSVCAGCGHPLDYHVRAVTDAVVCLCTFTNTGGLRGEYPCDCINYQSRTGQYRKEKDEQDRDKAHEVVERIVTAVQEKTGMSNAAATNADPSARLG